MITCREALVIAAEEALAKGNMKLHFRILRLLARRQS